jgi:hypothetical protein
LSYGYSPAWCPLYGATVSAALDQLDDALGHLRRSGVLAHPWLGDEISSDVAAHDTRPAMEQPDSSYRALLEYEAELTRVRDTLQRVEDHDRRTDQTAASLLRRT